MNIIIYGFAIIGFGVVSIFVYGAISEHFGDKKNKKERAELEKKLITKDCGCIYNPVSGNLWHQCDQHEYEENIEHFANEVLENENAVMKRIAELKEGNRA